MNIFKERFKALAAGRVAQIRKARPNPAFNKHRVIAPVQVNRINKPVKNKGWEAMSLEAQQEYLHKHPASKRRISEHHNHRMPHVTPIDPRPKDGKVYNKSVNSDKSHTYRIIRSQKQESEEDYNVRIAKHEAGNKEAKKLIDQFKEGKRHSKVMKFVSRVGKMEPNPNDPIEKQQQAAKDYKEFVNTYKDMDIDDLTDLADDYYKGNPDHAKEDGIKYKQLDNETAEDAEEEAENNPKAVEPGIIENAEKAYKDNPFNKMSPAEQKRYVKKAVRGIAPYFDQNTNKIISHAYQCLDHDQVQLLEKIAHEAMIDNMAKKRQKNLPKQRAAFLKIIGVAVLVAAGIAVGGPIIGVVAFNHAMALAHPNGTLHDILWNALKGKLANGKDDPYFDPHEDAVEKIVKSLKRQLTDSDDKEEKERLKEVIDKLNKSTDYHNLDKDEPYSKSRVKARPIKRKSAH